mmetsp:Transcript_26877/g.54864  ORF Transcript_26877/g.54864 Transcript_26877/m.54864 type:complete len:115 (+) Transcript_26877:1356-1700(+)
MSEEGDRPTLMQAVKERSTEPCVDEVAPTGSRRASPLARTAHDGGSTATEAADACGSVKLLALVCASSISNEDWIRRPRPIEGASKRSLKLSSKHFSARGLRVKDEKVVNGLDS